MQDRWETWVWSLVQEDPLEEGMATHSSILAWEIPWTEEPGGLQSVGLQTVGHDWSYLAHMHTDPWIHYTHAHRLMHEYTRKCFDISLYPCTFESADVEPTYQGWAMPFCIWDLRILGLVIHGSPTINPPWRQGTTGCQTFPHFTWVNSFHLRKPLKFLLIYFHTTLIRKVLFLFTDGEIDSLEVKWLAQVHTASQWSASSLEATSTPPGPCPGHTELSPFRKDPLFESPGVGFSLWPLPLWPAALVADCLLSAETCGKHKGPTAIALERLPFPSWQGSCCPVASRLGGKRAISTHASE